jgi:hypothetical protein
LHMGNGGEFASVGLSQLGVTETDEPALLWDVVLCGVGLFGSRSKPVVGWSVYRLELDCLKSNFADRARNEFEGLFSRPVVTFWKEARSSSASQHCFLSRWGFYISKVPGLRT